MMTFNEYIHWLEGVPMYGKKDGTRNMEKLMARFGDPQDQIPVIHVAGTNGKGSCCAMLSQILQESGYKVGLYTSPHLVEYTERIRVNGKQITKEDWVKLGMKVKEVAEAIAAGGDNHATFFELVTAIGFLYFAQEQVDVILLETGVGGRLDATNVVKKPRLCLITSISLDHTKVLGDTLPQIAAEKAGIIQPGAPIVLAQNVPQVQEVVRGVAAEKESFYCYSGTVIADDEGSYRGDSFSYEGLETALIGDYQVQNVSAVLCAVKLLQEQGWKITEESLRRGLKNTCWPGRMERREFDGRPVLLDGAHNPNGAQMLADYLAKHYAPGSCNLVLSALAKKDVSGIVEPLRKCAAIGNVYFTCIHGEDQMDYLVELWGQGSCIASPKEALRSAVHEPNVKLTVCAGSLYLVGEIETIIDEQ
ncbi:MAG: bifunctional folylpolyglutamate synthase/dihydrofolate synthase [Firmicutes bacterium]|nr:bifunctional folylpolyglutamate synthase/dihydrofolate synthase [Bacillota bacterium]